MAEYYIDDRNIVFTNWKDVVKTVDKQPKKKAHMSDVKAWITPEGKVIDLSNANITHNDWAGIHYQMSSQDLIEKGWVRIGDSYEDYSAFNVELLNMKQIPSYVDDFIASVYTGGIIEVEDAGRTVELKDPFPTLQKAVNKEIIRQQASLKTAQHNVDYDFSSTHFVLPKDIAQKVIEWSVKNIPNKDLYDDDSNRYGRELESHITVLFGLLTNDSKEVEDLLKNEKPVRVKFKKTKVFENDMDAIFIEVDSEDIIRLHDKLKELKNEDQQPDYNPHCTVAYVKSGLGKEYAGEDVLEGLELELDTIKFSPKEGDPVYITLGGGTKKEASHVSHNAWIDPNGKQYDVAQYQMHIEWIHQNHRLLEKDYGYDFYKADPRLYREYLEQGKEDGY